MIHSHTRMTAAAVIASAVAVASAEPTVVFSKGPGNTNGGIYNAVTSDHGSFQTFCLEKGEALSLGFTYEYTVGTDIVFNGDGTTNPLNAETAFIYTMFKQDEIRDILGKPSLTDDKLADAVHSPSGRSKAPRAPTTRTPWRSSRPRRTQSTAAHGAAWAGSAS